LKNDKAYNFSNSLVGGDGVVYKKANVKRAIVTGGAGFIGSHLVDALLERDYEVIVIDNFSTGKIENLAHHKNNKQLHVIEADVSKLTKERKYFNVVDYVFHLAGLADVIPSMENPEKYFRVNVTGTMNVVEAARRAEVKKFLYAASSSCYGVPEIIPTPESAKISLQHPYAFSKYMGEELVFNWSRIYKIPVISLRLFNVYGPRFRTTGAYGGVLGVFLVQKFNGKPLTVVGDGMQSRDFVYVSDVVNAFIMAAESNIQNEILNVGSGQSYTITYLAQLLQGDVVYVSSLLGQPFRTCADITKIKKLLGWEPKISLEEGVRLVLKDTACFRNAFVWTPDKINELTKSWCKYMK